MNVHAARRFRPALTMLAAFLVVPAAPRADEVARGPVHSVIELTFRGPRLGPTDTPARDVSLSVRFRYQGGEVARTVHGFWDGDGRGSSTGDIFRVRFCPTLPGRWNIQEVQSNVTLKGGPGPGDHVRADASDHSGFWLPDDASPGRRWYRRTDGSHPYIIGNTHYSFLSETGPDGKPTGSDIASDVTRNAQFFKKLRFSLVADRYPHPQDRPFLDDSGQPTDSGDFSHRPNPGWFHRRVDLAVATAHAHDLIADLILCGPDTEDARSTLRAAGNNGDPTPWLRYVAARYGSYPNVWICLCNEFDIKRPSYSEAQIARFGQVIGEYLPYPTPLSVHASPDPLWPSAFARLPRWADHQILQKKLRDLSDAADVVQTARRRAGGPDMPTVNDELSYQGDGDDHSEADTIESHLGIFLGGGYGTTGWKPGNKTGHYFWGAFDPIEHTAAESLQWLRTTIDAHTSFWQMRPGTSIFRNLDDGFRGLEWPGYEYVLGTDILRRGLIAELPPGTWTITRHDVIARQSRTLAENARGRFTFDAPDSRAVLFHFRREKD